MAKIVTNDIKWKPQKTNRKNSGPFFAEVTGHYKDGSIREISTGPWSTRADAMACLESNKRTLKADGALRISGNVYSA